MTDIDAIRKREQAATPGPWGVANSYKVVRDLEVTGRGSYRCTTDIVEVVPSDTRWLWVDDEDSHPGTGDPDADLEFIAAARQDVPALLAEVDQLRKEWDNLVDERCDLKTEVDRLRADNQRLRDGIAEVADRREADARVYQATGEAEQAGYHRGMATELRRLAKDRSGSDTAGVPSEEQRLRAGVREMADKLGTQAVICNLAGNHDAGQAWEALHDRLYALLNGDAEAVTR